MMAAVSLVGVRQAESMMRTPQIRYTRRRERHKIEENYSMVLYQWQPWNSGVLFMSMG